MSFTADSLTRRSLLVRGLGAFVATTLPHLAASPDVAAGKKRKVKWTKVQIVQKAQDHADQCQLLGGTPETSAKPGGTTVTCSHSDGSSRTCTFHSKGVRCSTAVMNPGTLPDLQTQHPWSDPGHTPDVPLDSTEPTLR